MSIPILIEPAGDGFRAAAGGPLDLSAAAESAAAAVAALRAKIADRVRGGAVLIEQPVPAPAPPVPVLPLAENPLFDDWLAAVEEYRDARDAEERAAEAGWPVAASALDTDILSLCSLTAGPKR